MLNIPVFILEQPGGTAYYGILSTKDIIGKLKIRRRSTHIEGIQRDLAKNRIAEIADYVATADAILPTPLVVSVEKAELEEKSGTYTLKINPDEDGFWGEIIDGQHRYEGLKYARGNFENYQIPVCIFIDLGIEDKATIFSTINSTQVKVPKSYIYDLFDYTDENTPIKFCHEICKALNYDAGGPLFRHVKMLGRKLNDDEVLSQGAFVDAVIPLITKNLLNDDRSARRNDVLNPDSELPLRQLYIDADIIVFAKIIRNYLNVLKQLDEKTWKTYILRSIGIKVFMRLLGKISVAGLNKGDLSENFFREHLLKIKDQIILCSTENGTNKKAEEADVQRLIEAYNRAIVFPHEVV